MAKLPKNSPDRARLFRRSVGPSPLVPCGTDNIGDREADEAETPTARQS